ncbi:D-aminoacyl-tRNA deacylase [Anaerotignum sp. MSJ-24]|uniref:D-aminoacyl-tRNA deacylase n=1 Tax=Anaerotignum sp. MSJ-24 TaxID=2841521 RepID=UPI001C102784|nr:D-aminoacyl-tRNA deacylase [Anaerotignum sp. MSJ-24]MBD9218934.1 D-tyrosyl-tRNA(Tyr) deacylase [Clostridiales bacterium]MBU5463865.1 D-tyrosyl-tRNA(Tyr) deacylase [Anaerotignum sp. MSJ-24]
MRFVIQRVERAKVTVEGKVSGEIGNGYVVLVGLLPTDDDKVMDYMLDKLVNLRIYEDENDKLNLSLKDIGGEILIVPNFTLYGDARKGRRPSYAKAAPPDEAEKLFDRFVEKAKETGLNVQTGIFRTHMKVELVNDGPVTILLDSEKNF